MTPTPKKVYWFKTDSGRLYRGKCMSRVNDTQSVMRINYEYISYTDHLVHNDRIIQEMHRSWWQRMFGL